MIGIEISGPSILLVAGLLLLTLLAIVLAAISITYSGRVSRLPYATRFENIQELCQQAERTLEERRDELSVVEQKIQDRDRLIAEVSALEERRDSLQVELENLAPARAEIDQVKQEAADAAADLAEKTQARDAIQANWEEMNNDLQRRQSIMTDLEQKEEALKNKLTEMNAQIAQIESSLEGLRAERDACQRMVAEARGFETKQGAMLAEAERLKGEISALAGQVVEAREIRDEVKLLQTKQQDLTDAIEHLSAKRAALEASIDELSEARSKIGTGAAGEEVTEEDLIADLVLQPSCLNQPSVLRRAHRNETEALEEVSDYLTSLGLSYHTRTINGFHTALKINDRSQLTVLAGVAGTGKSLLPRRYSEALGIHFLQIAVEPRWDSPQDLLGFYNYIEKRYRATDLARLLVHMDPYNTSELLSNATRRDHMSLVLLDEMNLARVEYYFSEFLSRLEARPDYKDSANFLQRRDATIQLDIRGLKRPISLFPGHNILFAGTMNDDESTQSLSEKVLDRGNVLQFAAPSKFETPEELDSFAPSNEGLSTEEWRGWVRHKMPTEWLAKTNNVIETLARIMEQFGRPFGHRLRDSILAYVANYPANDKVGWRVDIPLADQVEFRILPKLRGVDIENNSKEFEVLISLLRDDLNDREFSDRLESLLEDQRSGTGLFNWRGLTRQS